MLGVPTLVGNYLTNSQVRSALELQTLAHIYEMSSIKNGAIQSFFIRPTQKLKNPPKDLLINTAIL
jgi:hypothetical protein